MDILIAAAYGSARAGLRALLAEDAGLHIIGEVGSGLTDWRDVLASARPDVVVADDGPPLDSTGLRAALSGGGCGLVLMGDAPEAAQQLASADLPGWAFLSRDADSGQLVAGTRAAAAGLVVLDRTAALRLTADTARPALSFTDDTGDPLTAREHDVLQLLALGLPNKQIAARLSITAHTAKFHVASVMAKLGASSRTEAVTKGARRGDVLL